ncbi:MAG: dihydrofolate reductase [Bacteroidetes bacterium]|nr:dihydrofolate reductase [Bacteroidota bacterium]
MRLVLVAAIAKNNVIGNQGKLPWYLPEDLHNFQQLTLHHTVLMGRRTYESIGHPLPNRRNVVISSRTLPHVETYSSLAEALNAVQHDNIVFVIGGAMVFEQTLPIVDELYLTHLNFEAEGDTYFPDYREYIEQHFWVHEKKTTPRAEYVHYVRITKLQNT